MPSAHLFCYPLPLLPYTPFLLHIPPCLPLLAYSLPSLPFCCSVHHPTFHHTSLFPVSLIWFLAMPIFVYAFTFPTYIALPRFCLYVVVTPRHTTLLRDNLLWLPLHHTTTHTYLWFVWTTDNVLLASVSPLGSTRRHTFLQLTPTRTTLPVPPGPYLPATLLWPIFPAFLCCPSSTFSTPPPCLSLWTHTTTSFMVYACLPAILLYMYASLPAFSATGSYCLPVPHRPTTTTMPCPCAILPSPSSSVPSTFLPPPSCLPRSPLRLPQVLPVTFFPLPQVLLTCYHLTPRQFCIAPACNLPFPLVFLPRDTPLHTWFPFGLYPTFPHHHCACGTSPLHTTPL